MGNDIYKVDKNMLETLRALQSGKSIPKPFTKDTLVLKTYIAGTHYYEAKKIAGTLKVGDYLILKRESRNKYDEMAISILDLDKNKLGYLPRHKNEVISHLMDAGKNIFGIIDKKGWSDDYLRINISVYLKEL